MKIVLESKGYAVDAATDSKEAAKCISSQKPDLIILDVMMSTKSEGFDFSRGLKKDPKYRDIPILMLTAKDLPEQEKLERVNNFFNQNVDFVDDLIHWSVEDYWATPIEFLATGAGDCEDYSIAKYFTLLELGVDENKMRITYVKAYQLNQAHMVLTYFAKPKAVPLVLDNLLPVIKPATQRKDLLPVYSFNGSGLWLAKSRGAGKRIGGSDRLSLWSELKQRMLQNTL